MRVWDEEEGEVLGVNEQMEGVSVIFGTRTAQKYLPLRQHLLIRALLTF